MVDAVISWEDDDVGSACGAIEKCLDIAELVVFANGGDRGKMITPGDDKMNSSSWILHGYFERQRKLLGI